MNRHNRMTRTCTVPGCLTPIACYNKSGACYFHRRKLERQIRSPFAALEHEHWTPDPTQPERVCQWRKCQRTFTPASPFNKYFCSPHCQDLANADLGFAYRMDLTHELRAVRYRTPNIPR
jgi:hypothetical protein